jgi:hypothetical protein
MADRIILHAGTEKTGSTALQVFLETHTATLLERGLFYPPTGENFPRTGRFPKHRAVLEALIAAEEGRASAVLATVLAACPASAGTLILSDETLFGDWPHVSGAGRAALRRLAAEVDLEVWVWFREPAAYARSLYVQMLKNPRGAPPGNGTDLPVEAALALPWFESRLDYIGFVRDLEGVIGKGRVRMFAYGGDTIGAFLTAIGAPDLAPHRGGGVNASFGRAGVALLRRLNRRDLAPSPRRAAMRVIGWIDRLLGRAPLTLSGEARSRIQALAGPSLEALARDYSLQLRG